MKETKNVKNVNVEKELIKFSKIGDEEILKRYGVTKEGLDQVEADEKLEECGYNIIDIANDSKLIIRIKEAIINPFNMVLLLIAVVTFVMDIVIANEANYETFILLFTIVLVSATISFTQQEKSNSAAKKLQKMISNKIDVIRNGSVEIIDIENAVPGDIVKLSSGDMIPGDVRFLETKDLFIDQSSLTGESNPVEKYSDYKGETDINSLSNIGFMGSNIVSGSALALILTTGNSTYFGSMAKSISTYKEKSNFEESVDKISKLLISFMLVMVPVIFITNLVTKDNVLESLLFGITIAVGLMPEMLPVIMTSTLAKGAVEMSKKKVIVKRLGSIQTFGEMDVLCTDKTGTITEDKIILEKYMDVDGNDDLRILKHSFLNSYFQTGLKNLIDFAIIDRANKENMGIYKEKYVKEDEIPFDFERRRMSVVLRDDTGKRQLITKGAVDEILAICSLVELDGKVQKITDDLKKRAMKTYEKHNHDGLRIVAVAQKNETSGVGAFGVKDEKDMVLIGFVGFLDPPKESAKSAIKTLNEHGVKVVVITGDSEGVAINVCEKLNINVENNLTGNDIENLTDEELREKCKNCNLFSKISPFQKRRIVKAFQENGHTVGYMGDGINDAPPLKQADVGISVDSGVDIAKETADIILLEKDLTVLEEGVISGRKTFANISKYLMMATSGNFGNMLSVMITSMFLPFLPLLPIHILIQNLLCDFAQLGMPFDKVEEEYIGKPKKWETNSLKKFMIFFGTISTILDIACFLVLWFAFKYNSIEQAVLFQTGWFIFGIISQTLIIHMIRTHKIPFIQSRSSKQLTFSTFVVVIITLLIGFTNISRIFNLTRMPVTYMLWVGVLMLAYMILVQVVKKVYTRNAHEWI